MKNSVSHVLQGHASFVICYFFTTNPSEKESIRFLRPAEIQILDFFTKLQSLSMRNEDVVGGEIQIIVQLSRKGNIISRIREKVQ